jgi:hypothetical protein
MAEAVAVARPGTPSRAGLDFAVLRDRFTIRAGAPLPALDSPSAKAFETEDRRDPGVKLFALICTPGMPVRAGTMEALKGVRSRGLLSLIDFGPVFWPPLGRMCMAAIYEQPMGGRVSQLLASGAFSISEYEIAKRMIAPIVAALHSLASRGISHRQIRPENMYFMDEARQDLVLGDCATSPPGFDQPVAFESIERGLAGPGGRGEGETRDDVYALGATILAILLGSSFLPKMNENDILNAKIELGSFAALIGNARVVVSLIEPLRGMLNDDIGERWSLEQLDRWQDGQKIPSPQRRPIVKTEVTFSFAGKAHVTARTIARSMTQHPAEAAKMMRTQDIENWVRRALGETDMADRIKQILDMAKANPNAPANNDDGVVTRVAMCLDPKGPIRHRGFSYMPDGFGSALAVETMRNGDLQAAAETIAREYPILWFNHPANFGPDAPFAIKTYTEIKGYLQNNDPGFGIERCLYELNPAMPCQSPLIAEEYVSQIDDLLPALDRAASRTDPKVRPVDRHIAAFIAARFEQDIDPHLKAMASPRLETSLIGMLSLLAVVQWRLKLDGVLGLSGWIGGLLGPAINTYHSRTTRRDIERDLPRLVRQGSLPELFDLIDNAEKRRRDHEGYTAAKAEFAAASAEILKIEGSESQGAKGAMLKGQQTAAAIAMVISFLIIVTFIALA